MTAAQERFEAVVREQITRAVANALQSGVPSNGMLNRCAEAIRKAADTYAFDRFRNVHYKHPEARRSACGRGLGGVTDPAEVTCAGCHRTIGYRIALQEAS